jgi:hypothetical protein
MMEAPDPGPREEMSVSQYLLSVHSVEGDPMPSAEVMQKMYDDVNIFNSELQDRRAFVFAGGLQPADTATVVRNNDGAVVMSDGPFAETKEHLGGFWVIEARDLDAALEWAAKGSLACRNPVEVRPFQDIPES